MSYGTQQATGRLTAWLTPRRLALVSTGGLLFSVVATLYGVIDVVGDPSTFVGIVVVTLVVATGLARVLRVRTALLIAVGALVGGSWVYVSSLQVNVVARLPLLAHSVEAIVTGLSILRIVKIKLWVLSITPAPLFLTWYLALRRRYVSAVTVGGATLGFLVLTSDAGSTMTLLGVLGGVGTIGFGRLDRFGGDQATTELVAVVLAVMVVTTTLVSVVPGGRGQLSVFGATTDQTVESTLVSADKRVQIQGPLDLSTAVRFTVESDRQAYWRVAGFDRYTGSGWVSSAGSRVYGGDLGEPPGNTDRIEQRYVIESPLDVMPAAWRPQVAADTSNARVTDFGGLQPARPFEPGDTYTVESNRPDPSRAALAAAGRDYPEAIRTTFTQLPASTPDRIEARTAEITSEADSPSETAAQVEQYLERTKEYSLDVDRPRGDVADEFLFEMDQGYCTYYATTMVVMLRTQGIPARFVTGYTPGERTDDGEYVVRGLDAHAWVEVYFPDIGWVKFDPTPAGPRSEAEQTRIEQAESTDTTTVDIDTPTDGPDIQPRTPGGTPTPSTTPPPRRPTGTPDATTETATPDRGEGGPPLPDLPSREELLVGLVLVAGLVAGLHRTGTLDRVYRAVWLRWQPRKSPATDVRRAYERLEQLLARESRPRRPGETPREYLTAIDAEERAWQVYDCYERLQYAGEVTPDTADTAVQVTDQLVTDRAGWVSSR